MRVDFAGFLRRWRDVVPMRRVDGFRPAALSLRALDKQRAGQVARASLQTCRSLVGWRSSIRRHSSPAPPVRPTPPSQSGSARQAQLDRQRLGLGVLGHPLEKAAAQPRVADFFGPGLQADQGFAQSGARRLALSRREQAAYVV